MPTRLTGFPSLAYTGVEAPQPPNITQHTVDPVITDFYNFNTGDFWLNSQPLNTTPVTGTFRLWYLAAKNNFKATWILIANGTSGALESLTGNTGGAVFGDSNQNINTVGDNIGITVAGNPATHTLTWSLVGGGTAAQSFPTDSGTATPNGSGVLNILATTQSGTTVLTTGSGNTVQLKMTDANRNTLVGIGAGNTNTSLDNTSLGHNSLHALTSGSGNSAVGSGALDALTTGVNNCAFGVNTLGALVGGGTNSAFGYEAFNSLNAGVGGNVAVGFQAGFSLLSGTFNIILGYQAGGNYNGAESNNLIIGSPGVTGESKVIRLGDPTTMGVTCFIAGIRGVTTTNNNAVAVLVDSASQLGTISSSRRYKQNIQDLGEDSSIVMQLRPVKFNFKKFPDDPAWGLIAEEVDEIFPQLVVYDKENQPETVKYHELVPLLLNELQKLNKRIELLESICVGRY